MVARALLVAFVLALGAVAFPAPSASAEHPCYVDEDGNETCTGHGPWYDLCSNPRLYKYVRLLLC